MTAEQQAISEIGQEIASAVLAQGRHLSEMATSVRLLVALPKDADALAAVVHAMRDALELQVRIEDLFRALAATALDESEQ